MLNPVPDERAIEQQTRALLKQSDAKGRFPTPVDDIIAAANLEQPKESLLSNLVIEDAPPHLRRAMRKLTGRVRAVLDRKAREIHVDPTIQNQGRLNFKKLHEVGHDVCDWQKALGFADDDATLSPSVKILFEQEANIAASNLLFQHEAFDDMALQYAIGQASVLDLAGIVGASGHATFRRFVTHHDAVIAGVVLDLSPCSITPVAYRRHEVITSAKWRSQFGDALWPKVLRPQPYAFVAEAGRVLSTAQVVETEFSLPNLRNEMVGLRVELYSNRHNIFALMWMPRREVLKRRRIIVPTPAPA
ncbi:MAG: ImmA/IrrE family metallo-endopeptidase [Acidimicrobiales bacterium]